MTPAVEAWARRLRRKGARTAEQAVLQMAWEHARQACIRLEDRNDTSRWDALPAERQEAVARAWYAARRKERRDQLLLARRHRNPAERARAAAYWAREGYRYRPINWSQKDAQRDSAGVDIITSYPRAG